MNSIQIQGVTMTVAAAQNVEACSVDVAADVASVRAGKGRAKLLAECLDGADESHADGWRDYVDAVMVAAS